MAALSLDCLPFDCIVTLCEYLSADDLVRFGLVCTLFREATQVGYLWRRQSLCRWAFCDVGQISEGPQRWRRYFLARRQVEARMDTGKPMRDYRVRTLRGHEKDIVSVVVMGERGGGDMNWENPSHPLVVSLSTGGSVKAWDVTEGKAVWSLDDEMISCLAASESRGEVVLGRSDGAIQFWTVGDWSLRGTFNSTNAVCRLMYGSIRKSALPNTFLLSHTFGGYADIWDCNSVGSKPVTDPVKPVVQLWSPSHVSGWSLSSHGLFSIESGLEEIYVYDLSSPSLTTSPSSRAYITLHTSQPVSCSCWVEPRCLATATRFSFDISLWNVGSHIDALAKRGQVVYDERNMYSATRTISNSAPPVCISTANDLIITGDWEGCVRVLDLKTGIQLQMFHDHKGKVTDLFGDRFRVLSCSSDFSIRVYRWVGLGGASKTASLESRYTLLGGSVAFKQHDGFSRLLCSASCCVSVAGNQLKFYTFTANLKNT